MRFYAEVEAPATDPATRWRKLRTHPVARSGTPGQFAGHIRGDMVAPSAVMSAAGATVD